MRTVIGRPTFLMIMLIAATTWTGLQCRWKVTKGAMKTGEQQTVNLKELSQVLSEHTILAPR